MNVKLLLIFTFVFSLCGQAKAEDINDWIVEQLRASLNLRHVDYDKMYAKAMDNHDKVERMLFALAMVDYCDAYALDSLMVTLIDTLLVKGTDSELDGNAAYLLSKKYWMMILQNRYDEIERMACYIDLRWKEDSAWMKRSAHWHRMAEAGKDILPVSIRREKSVVRLAPDNLQGHMCINVDVNQHKDARFMVDTGELSSTILSRKFANQIGARMLPDSTLVSTADDPNIIGSMQLGVVDSLRIDGIVFYNLPIKVSDLAVGQKCDGIIGAPDLIRLGYMELSYDSIVFRFPPPAHERVANFVMNAGDKGDRSISLPYVIDGHKGTFLLDTGANTFMLPPQYAARKEGFFIEIGGQKIWTEGVFEPHDYVPFEDSRSFLGRPILKSFERLCFNFRDAHVDYIRKPNLEYTEYYWGDDTVIINSIE